MAEDGFSLGKKTMEMFISVSTRDPGSCWMLHIKVDMISTAKSHAIKEGKLGACIIQEQETNTENGSHNIQQMQGNISCLGYNF